MRVAPPLSPFLVAGMVMPPGARRVIEVALQFAVSAIWAERPAIAERLAFLGDLTYRVDPTDLPLSVVLHIDAGRPRVQVIGVSDGADQTATIKGPIADLLAMLRGDADGDALFFSRTISIEGATDAVVALRNALDDAGVDVIADVTARLGLARHPARALLGRVEAFSQRLNADFTMLADAVRGPVARQVDAQGYLLAEVDERLHKLERLSKRKTAR